jgi:hypothetical protein
MATLCETTNNSNLTMEFDGQDLTDEQRADVERSIKGMAKHSATIRDRAHADQTRVEKLSDAISGPLMKLIEKDGAAMTAFKNLIREEPQLDIDVDSLLNPDSPAPRVEDYVQLLPSSVVTSAERGAPVRTTHARAASVTHFPPYHFDWKWHRIEGSPPTQSDTHRPSGTAIMKAAAGPLAPGSGSSFVEAHAGFGLFYRPSTDGILIGEADRRFVKVLYNMKAVGLGSSATTEGGSECTILEEGQFKVGETRRLWRERVSLNETKDYESNLFGDGLMRIQLPVRRGVGYTFNMGAWLFVDNVSGIGQSGVVAGVRMEFPVMTLIGPPPMP